MSRLKKIFKSLVSLPAWVQLWMVVLVGTNLAGFALSLRQASTANRLNLLALRRVRCGRLFFLAPFERETHHRLQIVGHRLPGFFPLIFRHRQVRRVPAWPRCPVNRPDPV